MNYNNKADDHIKSFFHIILKQKGMNFNDNRNNKTNIMYEQFRKSDMQQRFSAARNAIWYQNNFKQNIYTDK